MVLKHYGDNEGYEVVMDSKELATLGGDASKFVEKLREKGVAPEKAPGASL